MDDISYTIVPFENHTTVDSSTITSKGSLLANMIARLEASSLLQILSAIITISNIWKILFVLLLIGNLKNIPFMWHMRFLNGIRFVLRSQRSKTTLTSAQIFQPLITSSHAPLSEIDFNIHKSNSSYFSDIDICRTHLVCTLFSKGIETTRGGTDPFMPNKPVFGLALGAVSCSFKRELKPYEPYDMWTRVLSWDEKWIYLVTHFVKKGAVQPRSHHLYPQQQQQQRINELDDVKNSFDPKSGIHATALSKCVFKQGRKTLSPELMLRASGLLPTASGGLDEQAALAVKDGGENAWSMERIEEERQRGMAVASLLAAQGQQALEEEFSSDFDVLGRHRDGSGITGVLSTLAQLARIKRTQVV